MMRTKVAGNRIIMAAHRPPSATAVTATLSRQVLRPRGRRPPPSPSSSSNLANPLNTTRCRSASSTIVVERQSGPIPLLLLPKVASRGTVPPPALPPVLGGRFRTSTTTSSSTTTTSSRSCGCHGRWYASKPPLPRHGQAAAEEDSDPTSSSSWSSNEARRDRNRQSAARRAPPTPRPSRHSHQRAPRQQQQRPRKKVRADSSTFALTNDLRNAIRSDDRGRGVEHADAKLRDALGQVRRWEEEESAAAAAGSEDGASEEKGAASLPPPPPRPNAYSFAVVLTGWSQSGLPGSASRAESLLQLLIGEYERQEQAWRQAWQEVTTAAKEEEEESRERRTDKDRRRREEEEATVWLRPNQHCFASAISAWGKDRSSVLHLRRRTADPPPQRYRHGDGSGSGSGNNKSGGSTIERQPGVAQEQIDPVDPVQKASSILHQMERLHTKYGRSDTKPNAVVYNALIGVCSATNNVRGAAGRQVSLEQRVQNAKIAEGTIRKMEERYRAADAAGGGGNDNENDDDSGDDKDSDDDSARPDALTYGCCIHAWAGASSPSTPFAAERAQQILSHLEQLYDRNPTAINLRPNSFMYTSCIYAWSRSGRDDAADKATKILDKMEKLADGGTNPTARPTVHAYCATIDAIAKVGGTDAGLRADAILDRMERRDGVRVDTPVYNAVINAWARSGSEQAAARADDIVSDMEQRSSSSTDDDDDDDDGGPRWCQPDATTYNSLINAWTKSGAVRAPQRAEEVLRKLEVSYLEGRVAYPPQELSYSAVVQAWAKSGLRGAAGRAEEVVRRMEEVKVGTAKVKAKAKAKGGRGGGRDGRVRTLSVRPTSVCYDALIDAYARSDDDDDDENENENHQSALDKVDGILRHMQDRADKGDPALKPTTRTYTAAILAHARSSGTGLAGPARAESLLRRMIALRDAGDADVRPNAVCYSAVIGAWAAAAASSSSRGDGGGAGGGNVGDAPLRAYELLREMFAEYDRTRDPAMRPNTVSFSSVIHAFASSDGAGSARAADDLLRRMIGLTKNGQPGVRPNRITFNSVINAYARLGDGARCEELLREMDGLHGSGDEDVRPDVVTYTTVLQAYANSLDNDEGTVVVAAAAEAAPKRADELLQRMWDLSEAGNLIVRPNAGTLTTAISVFVKSVDRAYIEKAEMLLRRMAVEYEGGNVSMKPGGLAFSLVLNALDRLDDEVARKRVMALERSVMMMD